jgi:hypothetical protein
MKRLVPVNDARFGNFSEGKANAFQAMKSVRLLKDLLLVKQLIYENGYFSEITIFAVLLYDVIIVGSLKYVNDPAL